MDDKDSELAELRKAVENLTAEVRKANEREPQRVVVRAYAPRKRRVRRMGWGEWLLGC